MAAALLLAAACNSNDAEKRAPAGTIRIGIRHPASLDPPLIRDPAGLLVARQIFQPLLTFDPKTLELKSGIADRWEVLDGGTRFVLRLRDAAKFHDGSPVTASDVVFSLNRLARKQTGSEVAFLLDQIHGYADVNQSGNANDLSGVRAIDERTVEITIGQPWFEFLFVLTHPSTSPVPQAKVEADPSSFRNSPVGTGPYRVSKPLQPETPGAGSRATLVLERVGKSGGPNRIEFRAYERAIESWNEFERGGLDVAEAPPGRIALAKSRFGEEGFTSLAAGLYLGFNLSRVPDLRVRRAVSLAIDRTRIADSIYEGTLAAADGVVPPGIAGEDSDLCRQWCRQNLDQAKALVQEALPDGAPPLVFAYQEGPLQDSLAQSIRADLAKIGLPLELKPFELTAYFEHLDKKEQHAFRLGWVAEYPIVDWFLTPLFRSSASDNHTGYTIPEVDDMLARARASAVSEERESLYEQVEARVLQDMALVPIGHFRSRFVSSLRVRDFYVDRLGGFEVARMSVR